MNKNKIKKLKKTKDIRLRNIQGKWYGVTIYREKNNNQVFHKRYFICNLKQKRNKLKGEIVSYNNLQFLTQCNEYIVKGKILETHFLEMSWYSKNKNIVNYAGGIFKISNSADKIEGYYYGKSRHFDKIVQGDFRMFSKKNMLYLYDIAISFAGENSRNEARQMATSLKEKGLYIFFDEFEQIALLGENGKDYFLEVFQTSKMIIILLDDKYGKTYWTEYERLLIQHVKAIKIIIDFKGNLESKQEDIIKINGTKNRLDQIIKQVYLKYKSLR